MLTTVLHLFRSTAEWSIGRLAATGVVFGLVVVSWSTALGRPVSESGAFSACDGVLTSSVREYGADMRVFRAEQSTAALTQRWQEQRLPGIEVVSPLRSRPGSEPVTICLYSGQFTTPVGPPLVDGKPNPPHNLLRVIVLNGGEVLLDTAGYRDTMHPETPADWERSRPTT